MSPNSLERAEEVLMNALDTLIEMHNNEIAAIKEGVEDAYKEGWNDRNENPEYPFDYAWRHSKAIRQSK